jgi:hypothetical protein
VVEKWGFPPMGSAKIPERKTLAQVRRPWSEVKHLAL